MAASAKVGSDLKSHLGSGVTDNGQWAGTLPGCWLYDQVCLSRFCLTLLAVTCAQRSCSSSYFGAVKYARTSADVVPLFSHTSFLL